MVRWGGCTDVGKRRPQNEDCFATSAVSETNSISYAVVADGMGGHLGGEVASRMAVEQIGTAINETLHNEMTTDAIKELLGEAIKKANSAIFDENGKSEELSGMGTTVTVCVNCGETAIVAHVGDSRAYLLRGDTLHQITTDHSLVQMLLSRGQITAEEAENHPRKNVITRAVGTEKDIEIDLFEFTVCSGDLLLLGSDGLNNMISDTELVKLLKKRGKKTPEQLAKQLVDEANRKGGTDNITAVIGYAL